MNYLFPANVIIYHVISRKTQCPNVPTDFAVQLCYALAASPHRRRPGERCWGASQRSSPFVSMSLSRAQGTRQEEGCWEHRTKARGGCPEYAVAGLLGYLRPCGHGRSGRQPPWVPAPCLAMPPLFQHLPAPRVLCAFSTSGSFHRH